MKVEGKIEFVITERSGERVVSEMPVNSGIKNPFGVVHAGALLWLADVTATVLVMGPGDAVEGNERISSRHIPEFEFPGEPDRRLVQSCCNVC